jgi:Phytanoyl-CoA dioxygenase (PhyH)
MIECVSHGSCLPSDLVQPMADSAPLLTDPSALRTHMNEAGFLYLGKVLPRPDVLTARASVLRRLAEVGEVMEPIEPGLWSGTSLRRERVSDLGTFWRGVSEEPDLRRLTHGRELRCVVEAVLGEPALAHDMLYLRAGVPGHATDLHYDYPFFARTTERTITAWVPLGDIPTALGPLVVVEGSNRFDDLLAAAKAPQAGNAGNRAALTGDIAELAGQRKVRLLTRDFEIGDVVLLSMFMCHGSLDNHAENNAIRLSFDLRFQPAAAPRDPRYFGTPPTGLTGRGYGELNGAKPLTENWHQR